jgi:hypothetical protein
MKNYSSHKVFRNFAIFLLILSMGSCLDYTVTTRVNRDGSIFRQYRVRGDSAKIFKGSLMIPSGSEWKISHNWGPKNEKDTASGEKQYTYLASRTFRDIDELNSWLATDTAWGSLKPDIRLKKQFRWFYTYYTYSEIYPMSFPFQKVPVDSFLTGLEQSLIMDDDRTAYSPDSNKLIWRVKGSEYTYTPADSVKMKKLREKCEQKFIGWMNASIIEDYIDLLKKNFKDEAVIIELSKKKEAWKNAGVPRIDFNKNVDFTSIDFLNAIGDSITGSGRLKELYEKNAGIFEEFISKLRKVENFGYDDSYTHVLSLPGKLYFTNSDNVGLNDLEWHVENMFFFMKDYEMKASSRVANLWIMVLSGLLAVGLIWVLFARRK